MEIVAGVITVSRRRASSHQSIADSLCRGLYRVIPEDRGIYQTLAVAVPARCGMYTPDLLVAPEPALKQPGTYIPASAAELAIEITSRFDANHDRVEKLHGYAAAGVPLYLLLDSWHSGRPAATLYGEPHSGMYRVLGIVEYGAPIHLPAPFDLTIDTGEFPVS
ncbi:Uma2 family endonuclease [Streptomyces sp. NPDC045431]|uniref:Uma2 family endonuclease n=1 Tax=Streptomyces sp. NPDC045431 TaxID=3155613 RepID=UPI0033FE6F03